MNSQTRLKMEQAMDLVAKEMKILENPDSKLYSIIKQKMERILSKSVQQDPIPQDIPQYQESNENINSMNTHSKSPNKPMSSKATPTKPTVVDKNLEPLKSTRKQPEIIKKTLPFGDRTNTIRPSTKMDKQTSLLQEKSVKKSPTPLSRPQIPVKKSILSRPTLQERFYSKKHAQISEAVVQKANKADFIVPSIEPTVRETRSGLVSKDKNYKTDLERMRLESDDRLKLAF
jgi:hypothetical protein